MSPSEVAAIEAMQARLSGNFYELLGVERSAAAEQVRDAYFQLSRRFHPDVFWRKELGPYKSVVDAIFRDLTMAFDTLSNQRKRIPYDERLAAREGSRTETKPKYARASYAGPDPNQHGNGQSGSHAAQSRAPTPMGAYRAPVPTPTPAPAPAASSAPIVSPISPVPQRPRGPATPSPFRFDEPQKPFVSRTVTLGAHPPPFVSRKPTPAPSQSTVSPERPVEPETEEQLRRRAAAAYLGNLRSGRPSPSTPTEMRAPPDLTFVPVTPHASNARRPSERPPPPATPTPRARISDRPPPPAASPSVAPVDARTSVESLLRQKVERGIQNRVGLQADFEAQISQARAQGDLAQVVALLRQAVLLCPEVESFKTRLERAASAQQDVGADAVIEQARAAERAGRWDLAVQRWSQAAAARPDDVGVLLSAAHAVLEVGQELAKAAEFARRATQVNPNAVQAHVMLSRVFHQAGREASARAALEAALRLSPSDPGAVEMMRRLKSR